MNESERDVFVAKVHAVLTGEESVEKMLCGQTAKPKEDTQDDGGSEGGF